MSDNMTMTFEINFDHLPDYVYIRTSGHASPVGFDKLLANIVNSPKWKTGTKQIIDHRNLKAQKLSSHDVERIMEIVGKYSKNLGHGNCAFIVKDDLGFGLIRMYELLGGENVHQEMAVFYNFEEAKEWIKL